MGDKGGELHSFNMASKTFTQTGSKKRKNDISLEEIVDDDHFSRFIVLTSKDSNKPLSKTSPFVIGKTIKGCAGDVKNVTKMKSGSILIEVSKKQQSLNLLQLNKILDLEISSTPHRTLNSCQGIIHYRDDDLSELTDEEICEELKPQGVTKVKRFIAKRQGIQVKLNTFLLNFNSPSVYQNWTIQR